MAAAPKWWWPEEQGALGDGREIVVSAQIKQTSRLRFGLPGSRLQCYVTLGVSWLLLLPAHRA